MEFSPDRPNTATTARATAAAIITPNLGFSPWFCGLLFLSLALGLALRIGYIDHKIHHMDEKIALAVVQNLSFPEQWDTNWAKTAVGSGFCYDQFNFSSYHYLLYFWKSLVSAMGFDWGDHPGVLRSFNGLFGLILIGAVALAARSATGEIAGASAACAGAVLPLLIENAHYLRCEAMLSTGVAVLLWLATRRGSTRRWIPLLSGGFIAGWMVACKATMGLALPIVLLLVINKPSSQSVHWRSFYWATGIAGLGFILGVVMGVPTGVAQPSLYFSGLAKLAAFYNSSVPPYTTPDMAPSIGVALAYLKGTLGWSFWAVTALGVGKMIQASGWGRTALTGTPFVAALIIFGMHPFFTERSYDPFLPIVLIFFGAGTQLLVEAIMRLGATWQKHPVLLMTPLLVITLALPAIYSCQLVFQVFSGRERIERTAALTQMRGGLPGNIMPLSETDHYAEYYRLIRAAVENHEPVLALVYDYNDAVTPTGLRMLQTQFHGQILGVSESVFPGLPTCSLNTMISPRLWLLYIPAK